jgi:hypothetical protein
MKKPNSTITIMAAFFLSGALFFSCVFPGNAEYGTLVIALPGDNRAARTTVSGTFAATLTYRVDCDGPVGMITRQGQAGSSLSVPLNPGEWTITLTVLNAAGQAIGSGTATAVIENGRTTALEISVGIGTGGNAITRFIVTSPVSAEGSIITNSTTIDVSVPFGTDLTGMNFTVTHTGISISPSPGTPLNFSSPQTFTVTAENGGTKTYTVAVIPAVTPPDDGTTTTPPDDGTTVTPPDDGTTTTPPNDGTTITPPSGSTAVWPSAAVWQSYGLPGITQPGGTTIYTAAVSSGTLIVSLKNADITAFNDMVSQFTAQLGTSGTTSSDYGYSLYEITYPYTGEDYTLSLIHASGILTLTIEPDDPGGFFVWPGNSQWAAFNLSGLTQPAGTTVADVTEVTGPSMLSVTLNNIDNTAYEDLLNRITALLGSPVASSGSAADSAREAGFMTTIDAHTIIVSLTMDTSYDEIVISAIR